ncbi:MAG: NAD(P)/FAD-dependent oxidoreductase [Bacteroidia bacterium]|nr:NAD(P)/FAD-dependent oxidoreductase [Bacteroidia bacterium]
MNQYDIVIVGSGLGGLLCGVMLSKEGYNVCILEKNHQLGGCLQTFVREGCIFDTGMHYIGSYEQGQILHRYFKYFGLNGKLNVRKLDEGGFDIINYQGKEYKYAMGYERFITKMIEYFPDEREGIIKYTDKLKEISNNLNLYNLKEIDTYNFIESAYITDSAWGFIRACTSNVTLQNIFAALNALYAGLPGKTPLYLHALINNFFIESSWRFVDGSGQLARLLDESVENAGGKVITRSEVVKFGFENDKLTHVVLNNGEHIYAKYFISDIHPARTFEMCETNLLRKVYRNRINSMPDTMSVFSIYCVLKENSFPYMNYNYYFSTTESVWLADVYSPDKPVQGYMLFTPASSKSGIWADCMTIICYMSWDEVKKWEHTTIEKRGEEYRDFKKRKAEQLLNLAEQCFPNLRSHIKSYYTSTPLTYRDYTATRNGSLYGVMKDCNDPISSYIPPKTKISNLFLTGQNVNLHGILGVTIGSLLTCAELTGLNYLIRKINNA